MKTLINYAKELNAKSLVKIVGAKGAFISITLQDDSRVTLPVGKRSQEGKLADYNILIAADTQQAIATINSYETVETMVLDTVAIEEEVVN